MPTTLTTKEIVQVSLGLELNGAPVPGTFGPQIAFTSSNTAVCGVKDDPAANTLDLEITGAGDAALTVGATCTFADPQSGQPVTQQKQKTLNVSVTGSGPNFVVTIS